MKRIKKSELKKILDEYERSDEIDQELKEVTREKFYSFLGSTNDEKNENFDKEENRENITSSPKRKRKFWIPVVATACILGIFVLFLALPDIPFIQAMRTDFFQFTNRFYNADTTDEYGNTIKSYGRYEEMTDDLGLSLLYPKWMPHGYSLKIINTESSVRGTFSIAEFIFSTEESQEVISIVISNYLGDTSTQSLFQPSESLESIALEDINGVIALESPYLAHFIYANYMISINPTETLAKDDIIQIIESLK